MIPVSELGRKSRNKFHFHFIKEISENPNMVRKFIIDTDTGVDDAMALLMALDAHKKGEVR